MKKMFLLSFVVGLFVLMSGCMDILLKGGGDGNTQLSGKSVYWRSYYSDKWFGNSPQEDLQEIYDKLPKTERAEAQTRPLYLVNYHSNYLYSLLSVFSLGIVVPVHIKWEIQKKQPVPIVEMW